MEDGWDTAGRSASRVSPSLGQHTARPPGLDVAALRRVSDAIKQAAERFKVPWRDESAERVLAIVEASARLPTIGELAQLGGERGLRALHGVEAGEGDVEGRLREGWLLILRQKPGVRTRAALRWFDVPTLAFALRAWGPMDGEVAATASPRARAPRAEAARMLEASRRAAFAAVERGDEGARAARSAWPARQSGNASPVELLKRARAILRDDAGVRLEDLIRQLRAAASHDDVALNDPLLDGEIARAAAAALTERDASRADGIATAPVAGPSPAWQRTAPRKAHWIPVATHLVEQGWSTAMLAELVNDDCWSVRLHDGDVAERTIAKEIHRARTAAPRTRAT